MSAKCQKQASDGGSRRSARWANVNTSAYETRSQIPAAGRDAMTRDQKIVAIGAASGVAAMIASVFVLYQPWPVNPGLVNVSSRLVYTLQANVFAVLPLLIGIMAVGKQ